MTLSPRRRSRLCARCRRLRTCRAMCMVMRSRTWTGFRVFFAMSEGRRIRGSEEPAENSEFRSQEPEFGSVLSKQITMLNRFFGDWVALGGACSAVVRYIETEFDEGDSLQSKSTG